MARERIQVNPSFAKLSPINVAANRSASTPRIDSAFNAENRRVANVTNQLSSIIENHALTESATRKRDAEKELRDYKEMKYEEERALNQQEADYNASLRLFEQGARVEMEKVYQQNARNWHGMTVEQKTAEFFQHDDFQSIFDNVNIRDDDKERIQKNFIGTRAAALYREENLKIEAENKERYRSQGIPVFNSALAQGGTEAGSEATTAYFEGAQTQGISAADAMSPFQQYFNTLAQTTNADNYGELDAAIKAFDAADLGDSRGQWEAIKGRYIGVVDGAAAEREERTNTLVLSQTYNAAQQGDVVLLDTLLNELPHSLVGTKERARLVNQANAVEQKNEYLAGYSDALLGGDLESKGYLPSSEAVKTIDEAWAANNVKYNPENGTVEIPAMFTLHYIDNVLGKNHNVKMDNVNHALFGGLTESALNDDGTANQRFIQSAQYAAEAAVRVGDGRMKNVLTSDQYNAMVLFKSISNDRIQEPSQATSFAKIHSQMTNLINERRAKGVTTTTTTQREEFADVLSDVTDLDNDEIKQFMDDNPKLIETVVLGTQSLDTAASYVSKVALKDYATLGGERIHNASDLHTYIEQNLHHQPNVVFMRAVMDWGKQQETPLNFEHMQFRVDPSDHRYWYISRTDSFEQTRVNMFELVEETDKIDSWLTKDEHEKGEIQKAIDDALAARNNQSAFFSEYAAIHSKTSIDSMGMAPTTLPSMFSDFQMPVAGLSKEHGRTGDYKNRLEDIKE